MFSTLNQTDGAQAFLDKFGTTDFKKIEHLDNDSSYSKNVVDEVNNGETSIFTTGQRFLNFLGTPSKITVHRDSPRFSVTLTTSWIASMCGTDEESVVRALEKWMENNGGEAKTYPGSPEADYLSATTYSLRQGKFSVLFAEEEHQGDGNETVIAIRGVSCLYDSGAQ